MKIDVVIPNYNGSALIEKNLNSVLSALKDYHGKIIIVDDASEESDKKDLYLYLGKLNNKKVVLLENEKNIGFSGSVNKGVEYSDADLVVLLNSDVSPTENFLSPIVKKFSENDMLFGIGCMDKSIENDKEVLRGRGVAKWEGGFLRHRKGEVDKSDTFWISGGSCIVRRDIFKKLHGFDNLYSPFYWEDIDLSYRAQKCGYDILFDSDSIVIHRHQEGAIKKNYSDTYVRKIAFRNELIFIWKNITSISLLFSHVLHLVSLYLKSLLRNDRVVTGGTFLALKKFPAIMAKRDAQKRIYKKSDKEILSKFS